MAKRRKTKQKFYTTKDGRSYRWITLLHTAAKQLGIPCNSGLSKISEHVCLYRPDLRKVQRKERVIRFTLEYLDAGNKAYCAKKNKRQKPKSGKVVSIRPNIPRQTDHWIPREEYENFYRTREWRELRYLALRNSEGRCECCGAKAADGVTLHVDHIKPRASRPDLQLALDNLQVLCDDCNIGKGAWDDTDWRSHMNAINQTEN